MSLNRVLRQFLFTLAAVMLASPAMAGFDYTPPVSKQTAPVTVPEVQAEPLDEAPAPAAEPLAAAPAPQAAAPAEEPVLKIKTVTPAEPAAETPAVAAPAVTATPMAPPTPSSAKEAEVSNPPEGMEMPQNPGLSGQPRPAMATVSVPPEANDTPLTVPPVSAPPVVAQEPAPAPAPVAAAPVEEKPPVVAEQKKPGLAINPYPLKDGSAKPAQIAISPRPQAAPRAVPHGADPAGEYAAVEGFGSDMALALALREVVPPHYSFSFAKGVNPGYRVSWSGGKPWNQVVRDMIAPLNLDYEIRGNTVMIRPAGEAAPLPMGKRAEAVPMAPASEENSSIETASGEEEAARPPEAVKEEPRLKKPETIQLSSSDDAADSKPGAAQPRIWEAKQGASLKETLGEWSQEAGVSLNWKAAHDYKIDSGVLISGTFANAVKVLFMHGLDPANAPRYGMGSEGSQPSLLIEDQA